jgi:predicted small secreted protein
MCAAILLSLGKELKMFRAILLLGLLAWPLAGCNTVGGSCNNLSTPGDGIDNKADEDKPY